jgi:hypothetical protein
MFLNKMNTIIRLGIKLSRYLRKDQRFVGKGHFTYEFLVNKVPNVAHSCSYLLWVPISPCGGFLTFKVTIPKLAQLFAI